LNVAAWQQATDESKRLACEQTSSITAVRNHNGYRYALGFNLCKFTKAVAPSCDVNPAVANALCSNINNQVACNATHNVCEWVLVP
ncbi:MAG: hypothetical protein AAF320_01010, partial [Myxococcota bacterium]